MSCFHVLVKSTKILLYFFILIVFLFFDNSLVFAQQQTISGTTINKRTSWSGTIIIDGDVTVAKNARLSIEPGTRILFKAGTDYTHGGKDKTRSEIIVEGILIVKGHLDNKVTFSSASEQPRMGDWYGIRLLNTKEISIIDYCVIEYGYNGISLKKSNPLIRNSQIRLNYNTGILAEVQAEPVISKNIISENGYAGLITSLGSKPILTNNLISLNQIGVIAFSLSQPNLGNLGNSEKHNTGQNNIFENFEYDLFNHTTMPILAENNSWGSTRPSDIDARIYDFRDDNKYGPVDTFPFFHQNNLDELLQLSQSNTGSQLLSPAGSTNVALNNVILKNDSINTAILSPAGEQIPDLASDNNNQTQPQTLNDINNRPKQNNTSKKIENLLAEAKTTNNQSKIDYNKIFLEPFLDSKKKVVHQSPPLVSNTELAFSTKGRIIVRAVVGKTGEVESAMVIKGLNDYYDRIAIESALKFKYTIGTYRDVPVRFYTNIFFEF